MQPKYYGAAATYNKPAGGGASGLSGILKIFGIFVGAILVIAVAFSIVTSIGKGPQNEFARLVARQNVLQSLLEKQKTNIRSSDLRTINATAQILVTGDTSALTKQMKSTFGIEGIPEDITAAEADPTSETTLKNAVLTGTFDKAYVQILRDKIAANYDLANTVLGATGDEKGQSVLKQTMTSLTALDTQLSKLQL